MNQKILFSTLFSTAPVLAIASPTLIFAAPDFSGWLDFTQPLPIHATFDGDQSDIVFNWHFLFSDGTIIDPANTTSSTAYRADGRLLFFTSNVDSLGGIDYLEFYTQSTPGKYIYFELYGHDIIYDIYKTDSAGQFTLESQNTGSMSINLSPSSVPEPSTLSLLLAPLFALASAIRKRRFLMSVYRRASPVIGIQMGK